MKTIVVYTSKTGFAKRYAEELAKKIDVLSLEYTPNFLDNLETYEQVIYVSNIQANKLKYIKELKTLKNTKLLILAVGLSEDSKKYRNTLKEMNNLENIELFYARGGVNFDKLDLISRFILKKITKLNKNVDYFDLNNLNEIIQYINNNN